MNTLRPIQCPKLEYFRGYLDAAARCLVRRQEDVWMEAHLFELPDGVVRDDEVLRVTFPRVTDCTPWVTSLFPTGDMIDTAAQLFRSLPNEHVEERERRMLDTIVESLCTGLWAHLQAVIDYRDSDVYTPKNATPYGATFTFIIRNYRQKRILVFAGGSE